MSLGDCLVVRPTMFRECMANIFPVDDLRGTLNRKLLAVEAYLEGTLCQRSPHFPTGIVFNVDFLIPLGVTSHLQHNELLFLINAILFSEN